MRAGADATVKTDRSLRAVRAPLGAVVRALLGASTICAASCEVGPSFLPLEEGARSAMLFFVDSSEVQAVEALDLESGRAMLPLRPGLAAPVFGAFYEGPLADVGFEAGPIPIASSRDVPWERQRPAAPLALFYAEDLESWTSADAEDARVNNLWLRARPLSECAAAGGCYDARGICTACARPPPPDVPGAMFMPEPPEPPEVELCPDTWTTPPTGCAPQKIAACPDFELAHPGAPACRPVGTVSDAGWPANLPVNRTVIYASSSAPAGGDGTRAQPYQTIAEAIQNAPDEAVIALAEERFVETLSVLRPVELWGASVQSVIRSPTGLIVRAADVRIQNLTLRGMVALVAEEGARVALSNVVLEGIGVARTGADVSAEAIVADGCLEVHTAATVSVARSSLNRCARSTAFVQHPGSRLDLTDVRVDPPELFDSTSIAAIDGARVSALRTTFDGFGDRRILHVRGATISLDSVGIFDSAENGIAMVDQSMGTFQTVWAQDALHPVLTASVAEVQIADLVVTDRGRVGPLPGYAVSLVDTQTDARRISIATDETVLGIVRGSAVVEDLLAVGGVHEVGETTVVFEGSDDITLRRARIEDARVGAMFVLEASVTLEDLHMLGGPTGDCLGLSQGTVVIRRSRFEGCQGAAVSTNATQSLRIEDSVFLDNRGGGVYSWDGSHVDLRGLTFGRNGEAAIYARRESSVVGEGVWIFDAEASTVPDCNGTECSGVGLFVTDDSFNPTLPVSIRLADFLIEGAVTAGASIGVRGQLDLLNGVIKDSPVGLEVLRAEFDPRRAMQGVLFDGVDLAVQESF